MLVQEVFPRYRGKPIPEPEQVSVSLEQEKVKASPKESEITTHNEPKSKIVVGKMNLDKAFKRHRLPKIKPPTTPKMGRIHYTKGGSGLTRRMDR